MDECVRLEDVGKQFDGQWVFRHVSLTLPQRQTTAIVGESGCGKTTLLQLINGVVSVDEGVLSVLNACSFHAILRFLNSRAKTLY